MSGAGYARDRIEPVLLKAALRDGYRIVPRRYLGSPLGAVPADSRFCSRDAGYAVLYAADEFATAFVETVVRDRFIVRTEREVALREISERAWARIRSRPGTALTLLDLRGDGCVRVGAPTDAVRARNHAAGRALAGAIHAEHGDIDGLLYLSRLTGRDVHAVFGRATGTLEAADSGMLEDHPELPGVLERYGIGLIV